MTLEDVTYSKKWRKAHKAAYKVALDSDIPYEIRMQAAKLCDYMRALEQHSDNLATRIPLDTPYIEPSRKE